MSYLRDYNTRQTPQSQPIPGQNQVANAAGGYVYPVDDWVRLGRFLVLGAEGGTYYATQHELTRDNAEAVIRCLAQDGPRAVATIAALSQAGRAPKNDPALFALALASSPQFADAATRAQALSALPQVARTGTHLLHFAAYAHQFRGWGRGLRRALGAWFSDKTAQEVAFQTTKYAQRDGWSMRDLLRVAHPQAPTTAHNAVFRYITQGQPVLFEVGSQPIEIMIGVEGYLHAVDEIKTADASAAARLIRAHRLPREVVPSALLGSRVVWEALAEQMPITALIRNLATLTRHGIIAPLTETTQRLAAQITNPEVLKRGRVHPVQLLGALATYQQGHGYRSETTWEPVAQIVDALDAAFYLAFETVVPANARTLLALDVSGSMSFGEIAGMPGLTPAMGTAALSLVTAKTEPAYHILGFSTGLRDLGVTAGMRLGDAVARVAGLTWGGTDCSLPMLWAARNRLPVDHFVVMTDNETWAGHVHPVQALRNYRQQSGIGARLSVVGMTSTGYSIADPEDSGMLDVVGFDSATPQLMADFARGQLLS